MNTNIILPELKNTLKKSNAFRDGFNFGQDFLVGIFLLTWAFVLIQTLLLFVSDPSNVYDQNYGQIYGIGMGGFGYVSSYFLEIFGGNYSVWSICVSGLKNWGATEFLNSFIMWQVMMTAMMMPTLLLLFNIKNSKCFSVSTVAQTTSGYLLVWAVFCTFAVLAQWQLQTNSILNAGMVIENSTLGGKILLGAGLIQFLTLKATKNRENKYSSIDIQQQFKTETAFKFGLNIGVKCVLQNWPLMCTMFVFGLMNVVMMGVLTGAMYLQKIEINSLFSNLIAFGLICLGLLFLVV